MYKNSRSTVLLPLVVAAAVALGIFLGQFLGRSSAESDIKGILRSLALPQNKVSQTLSLIETQYVDSVSIDSLVERALPVIVSELDPHSVYIPASEMQPNSTNRSTANSTASAWSSTWPPTR